MSNPLVEVTITACGKVISSQKFNSSEHLDPNIVDEEAKTSNTSYKFSGRHDHGNLELLNCAEADDSKAAHYGRLIASAHDAKMSTDAIVTSYMSANNAAGVETGKSVGTADDASVDDDQVKSPPKKLKKLN